LSDQHDAANPAFGLVNGASRLIVSVSGNGTQCIGFSAISVAWELVSKIGAEAVLRLSRRYGSG
jgi:hypothetical protein